MEPKRVVVDAQEPAGRTVVRGGLHGGDFRPQPIPAGCQHNRRHD